MSFRCFVFSKLDLETPISLIYYCILCTVWMSIGVPFNFRSSSLTAHRYSCTASCPDINSLHTMYLPLISYWWVSMVLKYNIEWVPLRVCRSTCHRLKYTHSPKATIEQVEQASTERSEHVKDFAHKMSSWIDIRHIENKQARISLPCNRISGD